MEIDAEWLATNGLGGFASGTVGGVPTRRYHGLLVAALTPPAGRFLLLSKYEETVVTSAGARYELSANRYPDGVVHPRGFEYLVEFTEEPSPRFVYRVEGHEVVKTVTMAQGANAVSVAYELPPDWVLELRPLVAFRDFHSLTHENDALRRTVDMSAPGEVSIQPYGDLPRLYFRFSNGNAAVTGDWYRNFEYEVERERGLDFREDLFQPFVIYAEGPVTVLATVEPELRSVAPRPARVPQFGDPALERLAEVAEKFIVGRGKTGGKTVIAGYPWFGDWGRDTMISLPGLTLVTGKFEDARGILAAYADAMSEGMLPNRFPDHGEAPEYNTVDATLWFFEASRAFLDYTGDLQFVRETLYPKMREAMDWHFRGTRYGIQLDRSDGLLRCGAPGVQLTWMDAKVGDWVVTPRAGKPVEIQALWYNALCIMAELAHTFGDTGGLYALIAARIRWNFLPKFWNEAAGCLYDVVDGDQIDASIRPNQIFAASLRHMLLTTDTARQVVATVERELLTPRGLRTLSPRDPKYKGVFRGGVVERDSAYHQGTAWPWLTGPFLSAWRKTGGDAERATAIWRACAVEPFAEVADGDAPYRAGGCFAQAWTVAELLRSGVEDVFPTALEST